MRTRARRWRPPSRLRWLLAVLRRILHAIAWPALVRRRVALPVHALERPATSEQDAAQPSAATPSLTLRSVYRLVKMYPAASLDEMLEHYRRLLREEDYPESQIELRVEALRVLLSRPLRKRPPPRVGKR
jgi:hypothetical protein